MYESRETESKSITYLLRASRREMSITPLAFPFPSFLDIRSRTSLSTVLRSSVESEVHLMVS